MYCTELDVRNRSDAREIRSGDRVMTVALDCLNESEVFDLA